MVKDVWTPDHHSNLCLFDIQSSFAVIIRSIILEERLFKKFWSVTESLMLGKVAWGAFDVSVYPEGQSSVHAGNPGCSISPLANLQGAHFVHAMPERHFF